MTYVARDGTVDNEQEPRIDRTRSATSQVFEHLLEDVISLRMKPGEAVSLKDLSKRFGTSRSPIREAIIRLTNAGMMEIFPQSGTRVAPIRMDVIREVYFVRNAIEMALVEELARRHDAAQVKTLREIVAQQRQCMSEEDVNAFYQLDERFHLAIAEFAGYPNVWASMDGQKLQMDRLRRLILPLPTRLSSIVDEHSAIVDNIEQGNVEKSREAMAHHLRQVFVIQETLRKEFPDYFE